MCGSRKRQCERCLDLDELTATKTEKVKKAKTFGRTTAASLVVSFVGLSHGGAVVAMLVWCCFVQWISA